jgi:hypothetical protein
MENEGPKTISVPQAGKRYFDLGKNASYEAARRGDLPVIRIGGRLRVSVVALERLLAEAGSKVAAIGDAKPAWPHGSSATCLRALEAFAAIWVASLPISFLQLIEGVKQLLILDERALPAPPLRH